MNERINECVNNNNDNDDGDDDNNGGGYGGGSSIDNENNDNDDAQKSIGKELNILKHSDKKPVLCKKA